MHRDAWTSYKKCIKIYLWEVTKNPGFNIKHRISYLHGNEAWDKPLTFKPIYNKNITEKLSTHITEIFNKQYFQSQSNVSCNFAKTKTDFWKIQDGGQNGGQDGGHFVERLVP